MASAPPAGILYPSAAVRPPAISILRPAQAARPPVISFSRLPSRRAHLRAVALSRPASPVLCCAPSGESACVGAQDQEYEYVVVPPPWMPSKEECRKFEALDMSRAAIDERFRRESVEARAAVVGAVAGVFRPLWDNLNDVRNFKYLHEIEEFHIGMPFGALMACIGMYHLWNFAPNLCLDVVMPYTFYKLSVLAADVRRRGFSPDLITRIKFALIVAMVMKDNHLDLTQLDRYIRIPVYFSYLLSVMWDLTGKKKFAKYAIPAWIYSVETLFKKPKLMKVPKKSTSGSDAKGNGELVPCVHEPGNPSGEKEGGQTLQLVSEPNDSSSAKQDGEAPAQSPRSLPVPEPYIVVEVISSTSLKEDGKLPSFTSKSHHTNVEENGELQFVSEPGDSSDLKEESELPQLIPEPDQ